MARKPEHDDRSDTSVFLDIRTALKWLEGLAQHPAVPPFVTKSLRVVGALTNKRVKVTLRVVDLDKDEPR